MMMMMNMMRLLLLLLLVLGSGTSLSTLPLLCAAFVSVPLLREELFLLLCHVCDEQLEL